MKRVSDRLVEALRERGPAGMIHGIASKIGDIYFDIRWGTDTAGRQELVELEIDSGNIARGVNYMPTHAGPFKRLIRELDLPRTGAFVDFGSGMGKVLLLAAHCGFRKVVGVEFSRELCEAARRNVANFETRAATRVNATIIEADVVDYKVGDDDMVFFLFNPFDEVVLERVLANIVASIRAKPRAVWILYNHPTPGGANLCRRYFCEHGRYSYASTDFHVYRLPSRDIDSSAQHERPLGGGGTGS